MEFKEIEQALANKTAELEAEEAIEMQSINEKLATLKLKEEKRQKEARDEKKASSVAAIKRRLEQQELEETRLREETEKRLLEERVYARKKTEIDIGISAAKEFEKALIEQQHIEELARKTLDDAKFSLRRTLGNEGEVIMPNPLARFLQKEPD